MNHLIVKRSDLRFAKDCLNALRNTELNFLLIQNFFSEDEIVSLLNDLKALPAAMLTTSKPGFNVFPRTAFSIANPDESVDVYFSSSGEETNKLKRLFAIDVVKRFNDVFKELNNMQPVEVLEGPRNNTKFIPVNFRIMNSDVGLKATSLIHNGSNVTARCANTYQHLNGLMDFDNQLSFFSLLQNCFEGGDLTIYDFQRDQYPSLTDFRYLISQGNRIDLENTSNKYTVHMNPGDLIIFPGGQLWHRVDVVKSGVRISLGGFAAIRYSDKTWRYWT